MKESRSKLDITSELSRAILERRNAHIGPDGEGWKKGSIVYLVPSGRTPYEVTGFIKKNQKGLVLLRAANNKEALAFSANPILYTTKKPERPKKPHHSRHR